MREAIYTVQIAMDSIYTEDPFTLDAACVAPAAGFSAALQIQGDLRYAGQSEVGGVFQIFRGSSIRLII